MSYWRKSGNARLWELLKSRVDNPLGSLMVRLGISHATASKIKSGERVLDCDELLMVADLVKCDPSYLLGLRDEPGRFPAKLRAS